MSTGDRWKRSSFCAPGYDIHEERNGCRITISNVHAGIEGDGCCEICYSENAVIFYDIQCSCPAQVPSKKNPEKLMKNKERISYKRVSKSAYGVDLFTFINEIMELNNAQGKDSTQP